MKIKAKSNGNIVDLPEKQARDLIRAGLFVAVKDEPEPEPEPEPVHRTRSYKRRDLHAEPAADPNEPVWPPES